MKLLQTVSRGEVLARTPDTCKCYVYILVFCENLEMRKNFKKKKNSGSVIRFFSENCREF